jgi:hypothetical protein
MACLTWRAGYTCASPVAVGFLPVKPRRRRDP